MKKGSPQKKRAGRRSTKHKMADFIAEYTNNGHNVLQACKRIKITRKTFYDWVHEYPEFTARLEAKQEEAVQNRELEYKALRDELSPLVKKGLKLAAYDPMACIKLWERLDPENVSPSIQREKFIRNANGNQGPQPISVIIKGGPLPERLRLVEDKDAASSDE